MPYIKQRERGDIWWGGRVPSTPGELNFLVTMHALNHIQQKCRDQDLVAAVLQAAGQYIERSPAGVLTYSTANDVMGAITCAALELDRRAFGRPGVRPTASILVAAAREFYETSVAPYEDTKVAENGDLPYPR